MVAIVTREVAGTNATVKNAPLLNAEIDNNFIGINNAVKSLEDNSFVSQKGAANGLATLDDNQKLVSTQLNTNLTAISNLATTGLIERTGTGTATTVTITAAGKALLDDANIAAQRTTLELGTAATTDASAYQTADSDLTAISNLATTGLIERTGTGTAATVAATAAGKALITATDLTAQKTILGIIGSGFQIADTDLDALSGLSTTGLIERTGTGTAATVTITQFGKDLLDDTSVAAQRTTLGLGTAATTNASAYQTVNSELTAIGGLTTFGLVKRTALNTFSTISVTAAGEALINGVDAATQRASLALGTIATYSSSAYQLADTDLTAISNLATTGLIERTGTGTAATVTITQFGKDLLDDTSVAAQRTTLGLGTAATTNAGDYAVAAKGVTGGDSHNHSSGGAGQISYSSLSNPPTLPNLSNDTSTNESKYLIWSGTTTGNIATLGTTDTKLYFNPSTGTLNSIDFNSLSDIKFKTDINDIENSLSIIDEIRCVEFKWINNNKRAFGVIAQEIEQILPNIVETSKHGKSVSYIQLIPILIQAVKEMKLEIDLLKNELT